MSDLKFEVVETKTLQEVLNSHNIPKVFALLSIDVEGHESKVLSTLHDFRPAVILIERSLENYDESLRKQTILTNLSYIFAARIGCNEVYIDSTSTFIQENLEFFAEISSIGI